MYSAMTLALYAALAASAAIVETRFPSAAAENSPPTVETAEAAALETVPVILVGGTHELIYSEITYTSYSFRGRNACGFKREVIFICKVVAGATLRFLKLTGGFPATYMCLFGAVDSASDF